MPSSSAAAGEAASSSPPRTSRTGLDIRSNPLSCRSLGSSNQSPNSLHRLRESAWSVGLAALSPKKFGGSVRGRREGAKGSPLLSGLGQRRVGCEPCSSGNASERCAARTDVAGEHAGLNGVGGVQEGLARTSDATSARSSPSRVGQSHSQQQQHSLRDRGVGGTRSGSVHSELEQRKHQQGQGDAHGGGGGEDEVEVLYPLYLAESSFEGGRIGAISSESDVDSSSEMGMSVEGSGSQLWRAAGRAWLDGFSGCLGKATSPRAVPPSPGTPRHSLGKTTAVASSTDVTNPLATAEFFPVNPKASPIPDTVHKGYRVGRGSVEQQHRTLRGAQASPDRSSHQRTSNTIDAKRTDCCGVGMQLPGECDDDKEPQHLLTYLDRAARCSSSLNDPASEPHSQRLTLGAHHHTNLLSWLGQSLRRSRRIKPTCA
ncbi:hypothetical protein DUNSADRAFT_10239 [Dunaliella salina]|uniref:Encoded protein n=1 Tax=Dunaliella salina TaxID=3046 RepID=A0ABQ7GFT1_DUNSA|nr:hypothetical protein DUNSADRAFT_10239 [Dunaliella salina]|eukprot:KAF5833449.1 hypothetical protein DUNSADRAFT_10239 [Dunaliella salina]